MAFTLEQFSVKGKIAVITGVGGKGNSIGRAFALGLSNAGATVVAANRSIAGAEAVVAEITEAGGEAIAVQVDIADRASVDAMAQTVAQRFGGVDILVNNAALMSELSFTPPSLVPLDEWNSVLAVNLTGALNCAQALVPMMRERGSGRIINILTGGAFPALHVYGISKLALLGLTTALAAELGKQNITVNAIAPGATMSAAGASMTGPDTPFRKKMDINTLMRVEGQPDELVGALLLLASPAGSWITGQVLHVDGGWIVRP